jgi:formylglycine-generating enzyme required for sulfatase activity
VTARLGELLPAFAPIPGGPFLMGTAEAELSALARRYGGTRESYREEAPRHSVTLRPFAIARTPTTNALYGAYVAATGARAPFTWRGPRPPEALLDLPVVDISWEETAAFCAWLSEQDPGDKIQYPSCFRLPTEAEWERVARGVDGRSFPWGEAFEPRLANTREGARGGVTAVGSYPDGASPDGVYDMAGNVWEWTASLDRLYPYNSGDGREAAGPGRRIMRGGCYANPHGYARCACRFRLAPGARNEFTGFRLALSLTEGGAP